MNKIGMQSNAYISNNEFGIDFLSFKNNEIDSLDYQEFISSNSKLYKMDENELIIFLTKLKLEAHKHNLIINQLHSLWDPSFLIHNPDIDIFPYYKKAILGTAILGAKYVVIHPIAPKGMSLSDRSLTNEILFNLNIKFFNELKNYAKEKNVKIAIENLPFTNVEHFFSPSGTLELVNSFNDDYIVMCLDTGHFNIYQEDIYDFILKGKDKVKCLHIHDNNGDKDAHMFPFRGTFNWEKFTKGIKDINFSGVLSLETFAKKENVSVEEYNKLNKEVTDSIKRIRDMVAQ